MSLSGKINIESDTPLFDALVAELGDPWTRLHRALENLPRNRRAVQRARKRAQDIVDMVDDERAYELGG